MNKEIRLEVLERALLIEDKLSEILKELLNINNFDTKSLGHKSSALNFITKVNLLYDIDKIDSNIYSNLQMFGEIRNQFMHNLDSDSYEIVLDRVKKKNKILLIDSNFSKYFKNAKSDNDKEDVYSIAFQKLFLDLFNTLEQIRINILKEKIENIDIQKKLIETEQLDKVLKLLADSIDEFAKSFNGKMRELTGMKTDYENIIKGGIQSILEKKVKSE